MTKWSLTLLELARDKVKRETRSNVFKLLVKSHIFPLQKCWENTLNKGKLPSVWRKHVLKNF